MSVSASVFMTFIYNFNYLHCGLTAEVIRQGQEQIFNEDHPSHTSNSLSALQTEQDVRNCMRNMFCFSKGDGAITEAHWVCYPSLWDSVGSSWSVLNALSSLTQHCPWSVS